MTHYDVTRQPHIRRNVCLTLCLIVLTALSAFSQGKLSVTTQMLLDELSGNLPADVTGMQQAKRLGLRPRNGMPLDRLAETDRLIAKPDTIAGQVFISAFVRLNDSSGISDLQSLGVEVQSQFKNGTLLTTLIPIDKIEQVAALSSVTRVEVSSTKRLAGEVARQTTNTDDVLTLSDDAVAAGLNSVYDGTGVIIGVVDNGIDYQHVSFKDKDGNSRIKRAYVYDGSTAKDYTTITNTIPTTDDMTQDHGTHTSSTAGGSSVVFNGSTVTVTDDHAHASTGGMAPGADLFLAGVKGLPDAYLINAVQKMCQYADAEGKPLVVTNSWGSQWGPHDGTGTFADVYNELFGDAHPNRVALFAASNDASSSLDGEGGGYHINGMASAEQPLGAILRSSRYSDTDGGASYGGLLANAWARSPEVQKMGVKILVLDAKTGVVKKTVTVTNPSNNVTGLSSYYTGTLKVYYDDVESDKTQIAVYSSGLNSTSTYSSYKDGKTYYRSNYTLAVQFYPLEGSAEIDVWGGSHDYFTNHLTTSGYTWTEGSDDMCVSDEATIPSVISVGAYVSRNTVTDHYGNTHSLASRFPNVGDIADFSSYGTASQSPIGVAYPWITAPGATVVAAVNHYHRVGFIDDSHASSGRYRVNNSTSNPYGNMNGTSMATPVAAGIVALWLQAAHENGIDLTVNDVKEIMRESAQRDEFVTSGPNATHFGNGKLDAMAGIAYLLPSDKPRVNASPKSIAFGELPAGTPVTETITVTGMNLESDVTIAVNDDAGVFAVDHTTVSPADATAGATVTVTFTPTALLTASYTGSLSITSANANTVTVNLTGNGTYNGPAISTSATAVAFDNVENGTSATKTLTVSGKFLTNDVTVSLNDANGVFAVDATTVPQAEAMAQGGKTLTISFSPPESTEAQAFNGSITLSTDEAASVTIPISGTGFYTAPAVTVSSQSLALTTSIGKPVSRSLTVSGIRINNALQVMLNDEHGVFTVTPETIDDGALVDDGLATITVGFFSEEVGIYSGTIIISGDEAPAVTVDLFATADDGGTASDDYLNIAKYATIDSAGWNSSSVKNLYQYTEYPDNSVAWLTLPVYGAWRTVANSEGEQKWIHTTTTSSSATGVSHWQSGNQYLQYPSLPFTAYFATNGNSARPFGPLSPGTNMYEVSFYVTNTTAVHLYGETGTGADSKPSKLIVYECTRNADGTVTESDVAYSTRMCNTSSTVFHFNIPDLDENTIYKVQACIYNGQLYDIGFQTLLDQPSLRATPFSTVKVVTEPNDTKTAIVKVKGRLLSGDVTVSVNDENGVFRVTPNHIPKATAETGTEVMVIFNSANEGTFTGTLNVSCGELSQDVTLNGQCTELGTASTNYLDVSKYQTIDDTDWVEAVTISTNNQRVLQNLYAFNVDDEDSDYGWLSMSIYGAWKTVRYTSSTSSTTYTNRPEKWIDSHVAEGTTTSAYPYFSIVSENEWSASTTPLPLRGKMTYFSKSGTGNQTGNGAPRALDKNSTTNTSARSVQFYVTNTDIVKIYAYENTSVNSEQTYKTKLNVYECVLNDDGTVTPAANPVKSVFNPGNGGTNFTLTADNLDLSKIYMVDVVSYRGKLYEIAFRTPMNAGDDTPTLTLSQLVATGVNGTTYKVANGDLTAVAYTTSNGIATVYAKDDNAYADKDVNNTGAIDYIANVVNLQNNYDQSNWVALSLPSNEGIDQLMGRRLYGVSGTWIKDADGNCTIVATAVPTANGNAAVFTPNIFEPCNFLGNLQTGADENNYFFVTPKPMEVGYIMHAQWLDAKDAFVVPAQGTTVNTCGLDGGFYANFSLLPEFVPENGRSYSFTALIRQEAANSSSHGLTDETGGENATVATNRVVYPITLKKISLGTGDVNADGVVDVDDLNILISIILGKDSADNYEDRAYILGNDFVDVDDVNALIKIMLQL